MDNNITDNNKSCSKQLKSGLSKTCSSNSSGSSSTSSSRQAF